MKGNLNDYTDEIDQWKNESTKLYRIHCCYPAASTSIERLWSDAGNMMTRKRCNMDPELLSELYSIEYFITIFLYNSSEKLICQKLPTLINN